MDAFDFDISPESKIRDLDMGTCAYPSKGQPDTSARTEPLKEY